jgi:hypothetical protein
MTRRFAMAGAARRHLVREWRRAVGIVLFQALAPERYLKRPPSADAQTESPEFLIVLPDAERSTIVGDDAFRLTPGGRVLLFVRRVTGPANGRQRTAYAPLSGANGVFDFANHETVAPRSSRVRALSEVDARTGVEQGRSRPQHFAVGEIERVVEQVRAN